MTVGVNQLLLFLKKAVSYCQLVMIHFQPASPHSAGIKGGGRPDGVLWRTLLRWPPDLPGAHLREPLQGEEVLLRFALRTNQGMLRSTVQLYNMYMYVQCVHVLQILMRHPCTIVNLVKTKQTLVGVQSIINHWRQSESAKFLTAVMWLCIGEEQQRKHINLNLTTGLFKKKKIHIYI